MILTFDGKYKFLSNFSFSQVGYGGLGYPTVEHAYQASKSTNWEYQKMISRIPANRAGKAKREGKKVKLRPDWDDIFKVEIMEDLLRQKFKRPDLRTKLLETDDKKIVEGNYWHDNIWGDCQCKKCEDTHGYNLLGKLLMKLREEYKNENNFDR